MKQFLSTFAGGIAGGLISVGLWAAFARLGLLESIERTPAYPCACITTGLLVAIGILTTRLWIPSRVPLICAAICAFCVAGTGKYLAVQMEISERTSAAMKASRAELDLSTVIDPLQLDPEFQAAVGTRLRELIAAETATYELIDLAWFCVSAFSSVAVCLLVPPAFKELGRAEEN